MNLTKIAAMAVMALALIAVIMWQRGEIKDLEAENTLFQISNESLQKQAENNLKFIEDASADLQNCLDSKDKLVKSFENVTQMVRKATPTNIDKNKVVDDATLRTIIDNLNRPLPSNVFHMDNAADGLRKD